MPVIMSESTASPFPYEKRDESRAGFFRGLIGWFKPAVRLEARYLSWEEGQEHHSRKVLVKAKPGVRVELLVNESDRSRFKTSLKRIGEHNYYQLKVWPRSTRDFSQEQITLLATLPDGSEKLYTVHACVE